MKHPSLKPLMKLALDAPGSFQSIRLTERQRSIVLQVRKAGDMTSRQLSKSLGISVQSATQQLRALEIKGYLSCEERVAPTGGIYHSYRYAL